MHEQRPDTDVVGNACDPAYGVLQQRGTQAGAWRRVSTARRPRRITGIGSGMLRRTFPGASSSFTDEAASE